MIHSARGVHGENISGSSHGRNMFAKTSRASQGLGAEDELFGVGLRMPALRTHQLPRGAHFPPQVPLDESSYWPATAAATGRRACHGGWAPRASLPGALSARTGSPAAAAEGRAMLLSMIDRRTDILAGDRCCRGMGAGGAGCPGQARGAGSPRRSASCVLGPDACALPEPRGRQPLPGARVRV